MRKAGRKTFIRFKTDMADTDDINVLNSKNGENTVNTMRSESVDEEFREIPKAECFKILGLPENASDDAVKFKYGALLRQYKRKVDEYGATYDDLAYYKRITAAYDTILGYSHDFADDNPTSRIPYKYRRKFGKFLTWFEQYRLIVMLGIVIVLLAVVFVVQNCGRDKTDMRLKFVGAFAQKIDENLTKQINEKSQVFDHAQLTFFECTTESTLLNFNLLYTAEVFYGQLMAKGQLDVVLIDKESFDVYVKNYAFLPLDDIWSEYTLTHDNTYNIGVFSYGSDSDPGSKVEIPTAIYGIDVTDTKFFEELGLLWLYDEAAGQEKTMIFCIARRSTNVEKSAEFLAELLSTVE